MNKLLFFQAGSCLVFEIGTSQLRDLQTTKYTHNGNWKRHFILQSYKLETNVTNWRKSSQDTKEDSMKIRSGVQEN